MDLLLLSMHVREKRNDRGMYPAMPCVRTRRGRCSGKALKTERKHECMHALCSHSDAKI